MQDRICPSRLDIFSVLNHDATVGHWRDLQSAATCSIRSSPKPDRFLFLRAWPSEVPALDSAPRSGSLVDALHERVEELVAVGSAQVPEGATIVDAPALGDSVPPVLGRMSRSATTKQPAK